MKGISGRPIHYADLALAAIDFAEGNDAFVAAIINGRNTVEEDTDAQLELKGDGVESIHSTQ